MWLLIGGGALAAAALGFAFHEFSGAVDRLDRPVLGKLSPLNIIVILGVLYAFSLVGSRYSRR